MEAPLSGGEVITKPVSFRGRHLELNFATSAAGSVRVEIQDLDGQPLPGFALDDCPQIFGDAIGRPVTWTKGSDVRAIDFDDCGNGWFMYDFATTISFIEDHPMVPEWRASWLEGYRSAGTLSAEDEAELDTFVMLRRLMLVCWIGSHFAHATEAQELGAGFTVATCPLAETYLSQYA